MDDFPAKHMKRKYTKSIIIIDCKTVKKHHLNCTGCCQTAIGFIVRDAAWSMEPDN
jgi:hypothetical protein